MGGSRDCWSSSIPTAIMTAAMNRINMYIPRLGALFFISVYPSVMISAVSWVCLNAYAGIDTCTIQFLLYHNSQQLHILSMTKASRCGKNFPHRLAALFLFRLSQRSTTRCPACFVSPFLNNCTLPEERYRPVRSISVHHQLKEVSSWQSASYSHLITIFLF